MNWNKAQEYENPPAGSVIGRCFGIVDLGTQIKTNPVNHESWTQREARIVFELPTLLMTGKFDQKLKGKPFAASWSGKQSLHASARLYKLMKGWSGKEMTPEQKSAFNPRNLLGKVARLNLVENGNFINIDSLAKVTPEEAKQCPKQINPSVFFSLDEGEFDHKVLETLPQRTRDTIKKSPEYRHLTGELPPEQIDGPGEQPAEDAGDPF